MKALLLLAGAVVAGAVIWFLASPLFVDEAVDEAFPAAAVTTMPDKAQLMAMPAEERAALERAMMEKMAGAADQEVAETMPPMPADAGPVLLRRGAFSDVDALHRGAGDALVYALPDGSQLLRLENFRASNGPDLYVYLARHPAPARAADVEQGYLSLGRLKGNVGNQNYAIPAGTALEEYGSVVIWCQLFGVLFSPAPLTAVQP